MGTCQHKEYETRLNVGWDIDESGEEDQHLDICKACGAKRFRCDRTNYPNMTSELVLGEWIEEKP